MSKKFVIVVGVDFENDAQRAFQTAVNMAWGYPEPEIHTVYVDSSLAAQGGEIASDPRTISDRSDEALAKLDEMAGALIKQRLGEGDPRIVKKVVGHYRVGRAAEEVVQLAVDLNADMIAVGTRGKRGLKRLLLGSVAADVVKLARCPVFVIRPKDHDDVGEVPAIDPPCQTCVEVRAKTEGKEYWCEQHANMKRVRRHSYHYSEPPPPSSSSTRWGAMLD